MRSFSISLAMLLILAAAGFSSAANIATQDPINAYDEYYLGGYRWSGFTNDLVQTHSITHLENFEDYSQIEAFDALWLDQEYYGSRQLSPIEIDNIRAFISSGHKAVLIGENYSWNTWNNSILEIVSGGFQGACSKAVGYTISDHMLADNVSATQMICGSIVLSSVGAPDMLFDNNMAAVYAIGAGEALVVLDVNWVDDDYRSLYDNTQFSYNVIDWLDIPVITLIDIDIRPGSDDGCININGNGVIPIAIMGSEDFDVSLIDPASLLLEGLAVKTVGKKNKLLAHYEDVNFDGYTDLMVQFEDSGDISLEGIDTATLSGYLYDGTLIEGSDQICLVHENKRFFPSELSTASHRLILTGMLSEMICMVIGLYRSS